MAALTRQRTTPCRSIAESERKHTGSVDLVALVVGATDYKHVTCKTGRIACFRSFTLADETAIGFRVNQWINSENLSLDRELLETVPRLQAGDVIVCRDVEIKSSRRHVRTEGAMQLWLRPESKALSGAMVIITHHAGRKIEQSNSQLTAQESARAEEVFKWGCSAHATLLSGKKSLLTGFWGNWDAVGAHSNSPRGCTMLSSLAPNRNHSFDAVLVRVLRPRSPSAASTSKKKFCRGLNIFRPTLIFSDCHGIEVPVACVHPFFSRQSILEELQTFEGRVCHVEDVYVNQLPSAHTSCGARAPIWTNPNASIRCLDWHHPLTKPILQSCGMLPREHTFIGTIERLVYGASSSGADRNSKFFVSAPVNVISQSSPPASKDAGLENPTFRTGNLVVSVLDEQNGDNAQRKSTLTTSPHVSERNNELSAPKEHLVSLIVHNDGIEKLLGGISARDMYALDEDVDNIKRARKGNYYAGWRMLEALCQGRAPGTSGCRMQFYVRDGNRHSQNGVQTGAETWDGLDGDLVFLDAICS